MDGSTRKAAQQASGRSEQASRIVVRIQVPRHEGQTVGPLSSQRTTQCKAIPRRLSLCSVHKVSLKFPKATLLKNKPSLLHRKTAVPQLSRLSALKSQKQELKPVQSFLQVTNGCYSSRLMTRNASVVQRRHISLLS